MKKERQKGSITVEATLFIPIFLFAFMSIYSLVSFARAQLLIQYAADQAAREVAQYSSLSGCKLLCCVIDQRQIFLNFFQAAAKTGRLLSCSLICVQNTCFFQNIASTDNGKRRIKYRSVLRINRRGR